MNNKEEMMYLSLKEPFEYKIIKWRVGATTKDKTKGLALAYIDARAVMNRLDDVLGFENWQVRYPFEGCCEIGIKIVQEWLWKANCAGKTEVEAYKGEASDAFKRAATLFGIGRYLYSLDNIWTEIEPCGLSYKIKTNPNLPIWALPKNEKESKYKDPSQTSPPIQKTSSSDQEEKKNICECGKEIKGTFIRCWACSNEQKKKDASNE